MARPLPPAADVMMAMGWTPTQQETIRWIFANKLPSANLRLKGYAGWLSTEPAFLTAGAGVGRPLGDIA